MTIEERADTKTRHGIAGAADSDDGIVAASSADEALRAVSSADEALGGRRGEEAIDVAGGEEGACAARRAATLPRVHCSVYPFHARRRPPQALLLHAPTIHSRFTRRGAANSTRT